MLFWGCNQIREFWHFVEEILRNFFPDFVISSKEAIFGHLSSNGDSIFNTILTLSRYFIYINKFAKKALNEIHYINYIKDELNIIWLGKKAEGRENVCNIEWQNILKFVQTYNQAF